MTLQLDSNSIREFLEENEGNLSEKYFHELVPGLCYLFMTYQEGMQEGTLGISYNLNGTVWFVFEVEGMETIIDATEILLINPVSDSQKSSSISVL